MSGWGAERPLAAGLQIVSTGPLLKGKKVSETAL
jgi:hypothetical protein